MMNLRVTTLLSAVLALSVLGCSSDQDTNLEYMPGMMDQAAVKAYEPGTTGTQSSSRAPVPGTVARSGGTITTDLSMAEAERLKNPLPETREVFERGQELYNTYCFVCHGKTGEGDGPVVPYFPKPPSLSTDAAQAYSDGKLFHIMTSGQNTMPSYAGQLSVEERWAVARYVRVLQRAANPTADDIKAVREALGQ